MWTRGLPLSYHIGHRSMTYEAANSTIDGTEVSYKEESLRHMFELSKQVHKWRLLRGREQIL